MMFVGMEYQKIGRYLSELSSAWANGDIEVQKVAEQFVETEKIAPDDVILNFVPRLYEAAGRKFDDLKTHKSCLWVYDNETDNNSYEGAWQCRDCGTDGICQTLEPKGDCQSFHMINWDSKNGVRQRSRFRPDAFDHPTNWVTGTFGLHSHYEMPSCSPDLTLPCFELNRCARDDGPMKVFIYNPEMTPALLDGIRRAERLMPNDIQYTSNHDEGCLFIVEPGTFKEKEDMLDNPLYMGKLLQCSSKFGAVIACLTSPSNTIGPQPARTIFFFIPMSSSDLMEIGLNHIPSTWSLPRLSQGH